MCIMATRTACRTFIIAVKVKAAFLKSMIIGLQMEVRTMKFLTKILLIATLLVTMVPAVCSAGAVTKDGYYKGIKLCGKVKVVKSFADIKVQVVKSFPDLKVQKVSSFPDKIGQWQFVDAFPDFTIQFVDSFPDIKIQYVDSFPGVR